FINKFVGKMIHEAITSSQSIEDLITRKNDLINKANQKIAQVEQIKRTQTLCLPDNRQLDPTRSNYHVFTVLDSNSNDSLVLQIDGANPAQPMSIANFTKVTRPMDRLVIFRKDS
ncbi:MAG: hypothetical protein ACRCXZ_07280, partial [Patescibacteria group bacterium]